MPALRTRVLPVMFMLQWKRLSTRYDTRLLHLPFSLTTTVTKLQSLHSHTSVEFFAMVTRASVDDIIQPLWMGSDGASLFLNDSLGTNTWDMLRQFEQYSCARKFGKPFLNPG